MAVFSGCLLLLSLTLLAAGKMIAFKKILLQGTTTVPSLRSWTTQSTEHCAQACAGLSECRSFSVQSGTRECSLYSSRMTVQDISASGPEQKTFYNMDHSGQMDSAYDVIPGTGKRALLIWRGTWGEAKTACHNNGSQLLVIEDLETLQAVQDYLKAEAPGVNTIYVGGVRASNGQWLWLDGRVVADMWHPGQPSGDGAYDCLQLWNNGGVYLLDDTGCYHSQPALCEI